MLNRSVMIDSLLASVERDAWPVNFNFQRPDCSVSFCPHRYSSIVLSPTTSKKTFKTFALSNVTPLIKIKESSFFFKLIEHLSTPFHRRILFLTLCKIILRLMFAHFRSLEGRVAITIIATTRTGIAPSQSGKIRF